MEAEILRPGTRIAEYELGAVIGTGATSIVYRAERRGQAFAIKLMRPTRTEEALRAALLFRKEAAVIARLNHPGLVRVIEVGEHERQVFVVMELIESASLLAALRQGPLDEARVLRIAKRISGVLAHVHRFGLIHRDVKPDNILYDGEENAKLIDFGFAAEEEMVGKAKAEVAGSFMYSAPEQSGMLKLPVTGRSDLYALGAVLFECVAGRPVFEGSTALELMQKHASAPAPDLLALRPETRPVLASIVAKLLAKDPDDRYQSAEGLLADLEALPELEIAARRGELRLDARQLALRVHHEVPLVGRDAELAQLHRAWARALAGQGTALQIEGEGGLGKTRLTLELLVQAAAEGTLVLRGKCQQSETVPFGVLREAIDDYILRILKMPEAEREPRLDAFRAAVGEMAPIIKRLSRGLERLLKDTSEALLLDPVSEQARFYDNLAELLRRLAEAGDPVLLLVDDIQWLDASSLEVIQRLAAGMGKSRLLILTTARNDAESLPAMELYVNQLAPTGLERIILRPLSAGAVGLFVEAFLGGTGLDPAIIERLTAVTNGNVFAVGEYVRSMLDAGALTPASGAWKVDETRFSQLTLSKNVLELVANRVKLLSRETLAVAGLAAVHGSSFDADLLVRASGASASGVRFALEEAARATLIERLDGEGFSFVHDRVREALIEGLTEAEGRDRHQALADALFARREEDSPEYIFSLARHFIGGHVDANLERVLLTCLEAGQLALDNYANPFAYELLSHAMEARRKLVIQGRISVETIELDEALGKAASRTGRLREAHEHFSKCLRRARTPAELARTHLQISSTYLNEGNPGEAWISLEKCLQTVGRPFPSNRVLLAFSLLWQAFWGLFLDRTGIGFGRGTRKLRDFRETLSQIVPLASGINMYLGRQDRGSYFMIRDFANTHFLGPGKERARSTIYYSYFIGYLHANAFRSRPPFRVLTLGMRGRLARYYLRRAMQLAEQSGDKAMLAFCHYVGPQAVGGLGDIVEGERMLREGLPLQKKYAGAYYPAVTIMVTMLYLCWRGLSREAVDLAYAEAETMTRSENLLLQQLVLGMQYSQLCLLDRMSEAIQIREQWLAVAAQSPKFDFAQSEVWIQHLFVLLDQRELGAEAEKYIEDFLRLRIYLHFNMHGNTIIGHVRFQQFLRSPDSPAARKALAAAIANVVHYEDTAPFQCHVLVWKSALAAAAGKLPAATRMLERAQRLALECDSQWGLYEIAYQRARVIRQSGDPVTARAMARVALDLSTKHGWRHRGRHVARDFSLEEHAPVAGATSPASLGGRASAPGGRGASGSAMIVESYAEALLRISLASASSLDPEEQARACLDEMVRILNAERAFLFVLEGPEDRRELKMRSGRDSAGNTLAELLGYSSTVVRKVSESAKSLVVSGTDEGEVLGSQSAVAHNLRSIVAAPLLLQGRLLGVVYLDSRLSKGIFTQKEVSVLEAVANHLAIGIETAHLARREAERRELEKDLALTAAVQSFFLPEKSVARTGNLSLAGYYQAASQASGDWWWYEAPREGELSVLVGDVTGHGAASAMLTASTSAYLLSLSRTRRNLPLDEVLAELSEGFHQIARDRYSMTMSAIQIDGAARKLRFWSAAAPPLYVLRREQRPKVVTVPGTPLGGTELRLGFQEVQLEPRDRVFVFTDGLPELEMPEERTLKSKGLLGIVGAAADLPLERAVGQIASDIDVARAGIPLRDDLTFVMIEID